MRKAVIEGSYASVGRQREEGKAEAPLRGNGIVLKKH